jgi:hypothetical protein
MLTKEDKEKIDKVYKKFLQAEETGWTELDENILLLDNLKDREVLVESQIRAIEHSAKGIRCHRDHGPKEGCYAPKIFEVVELIIKQNPHARKLVPEDRYILIYYLTMCEMEFLISAT